MVFLAESLVGIESDPYDDTRKLRIAVLEHLTNNCNASICCASPVFPNFKAALVNHMGHRHLCALLSSGYRDGRVVSRCVGLRPLVAPRAGRVV